MSSLTFLGRSLLLALAVAAGGCTVTDRDVSHDPHFLVGYRPGQVYRLTQPVNLLQVGEDYLYLVPPGKKMAFGRPAGTLAAGSRIKILTLRYIVVAAPIQWESGVTTDAQLIERPNWIVALNDISGVRWVDGDYGMKAGVLTPDSRWLSLVQPVGEDAR